jgi:hypothetical protein
MRPGIPAGRPNTTAFGFPAWRATIKLVPTKTAQYGGVATPAERQGSGFWSDSNGLADPGDPASANQSIWF